MLFHARRDLSELPRIPLLRTRVNKSGNSPFMPSSLRGSSSPQAPPPLENGGYGEAVDGAVGEAVDGAVGGAVDGAVGEAGDVAGLMMVWMPTTVDTLIMDNTTATRAVPRRVANRIDFFVSHGKAPNRQRAVNIPRIPSLRPST